MSAERVIFDCSGKSAAPNRVVRRQRDDQWVRGDIAKRGRTLSKRDQRTFDGHVEHRVVIALLSRDKCQHLFTQLLNVLETRTVCNIKDEGLRQLPFVASISMVQVD